MSETISDIVREMREWPHHEVLGNWPDRIEAAEKKMAVPTPEQWTELARQGSEVASLRAEVEKLRNELAAEMRTCDRLRDALAKIELRLRLFAAPEVAKSYIEATRKIALDALEGGAK